MKKGGEILAQALKLGPRTQSRLFSTGNKAAKDSKRKSLWSSVGPSEEQRMVVQTHYWPSCTIRGKQVQRVSLLDLVYNHFRYDFVSRGQHKDESADPINHLVGGLIGNRSPVKLNEDGTVNEVETAILLEEHRKGNIHGLSTTGKFGIALSFSCFLSRLHEIMLIDRVSIPKVHQHMQVYDPNLAETGSTGEPLTYDYENELTVTGVPTSSILARVTREGLLSFKYMQNPLYVDPMTLSPKLKGQFIELNNMFFRIAAVIRENPNTYNPLVEDYKQMKREFYAAFILEQSLDPLRSQAIRIEVGIDLPELTDETGIKFML